MGAGIPCFNYNAVCPYETISSRPRGRSTIEAKADCRKVGERRGENDCINAGGGFAHSESRTRVNRAIKVDVSPYNAGTVEGAYGRFRAVGQLNITGNDRAAGQDVTDDVERLTRIGGADANLIVKDVIAAEGLVRV